MRVMIDSRVEDSHSGLGRLRECGLGGGGIEEEEVGVGVSARLRR